MLFCDLAGSERILKSGVQGEMRDEAVGINSSLTSLGRVIKQLGAGDSHVSYRDCTLTMLLRSSFGGRSCTSVVVNVAGDAVHSNETVASLRFGARMAQVRNNATVVVGQDSKTAVAGAEAALATAERELSAMERAGCGARFGADAVPSEIRTYKRNLAELEDTSRCLLAYTPRYPLRNGDQRDGRIPRRRRRVAPQARRQGRGRWQPQQRE